MARQAYIDTSSKRVFFWSAKSGCTSLVRWFVLGRLGRDASEFGGGNVALMRAWLVEEGYLCDYRRALKLIENQRYSQFYMCRHPLRRAISAYQNKFVSYWNKPHLRYSELELAPQQLYCAIKGLSDEEARKLPYEGISFLEFMRHLAPVVSSSNGNGDVNQHWATQVPRSYYDQKFKYETIFPLERSWEADSWLKETYQTELGLEWSNMTGWLRGREDKDCTSLKSVEIAEHPALFKRENFINDEIIDLVAKAYKIDYDTFKYDPRDVDHAP